MSAASTKENPAALAGAEGETEVLSHLDVTAEACAGKDDPEASPLDTPTERRRAALRLLARRLFAHRHGAQT